MESFLEFKKQDKENIAKIEKKILEKKQRETLKIEVTQGLTRQEKLSKEIANVENRPDPFKERTFSTIRKINDFKGQIEALSVKQLKCSRQALYFRRQYENCLKKKKSEVRKPEKSQIAQKQFGQSNKKI